MQSCTLWPRVTMMYLKKRSRQIRFVYYCPAHASILDLRLFYSIWEFRDTFSSVFYCLQNFGHDSHMFESSWRFHVYYERVYCIKNDICSFLFSLVRTYTYVGTRLYWGIVRSDKKRKNENVIFARPGNAVFGERGAFRNCKSVRKAGVRSLGFIWHRQSFRERTK